MKKHLALALFAAVVLTSFEAQAWTVDSKKGSAILVETGVEAEVGRDLLSGTLIETGEGARLKLREGGSTFFLGAKTRVRLPKPDSSKATYLELLMGKLRAIVMPSDASRIQIRTPTAVAGVRGTEFFISTDGSSDMFCTLEGKVAVQSDSSNSEVLVPEGMGLRLIRGRYTLLAINSQAQTEKWVAETDQNDGSEGFPALSTPKPNSYKLIDGFEYGATLQVLTRNQINPDFDLSRENNNDLLLTQMRLEPFVQGGITWGIRLAPNFYSHHSDVTTSIDSYPPVREYQRFGASPGRSYLFYQDSRQALALGSLRLKWGEGTHVADGSTRPDGNHYAGLNYRISLGNMGIEALYSQGGLQDGLNGISHIKMHAMKLDFPFDWGFIFYTQRDFGLRSHLPGVGNSESHQLLDIGIYSEHRFPDWSYKALGVQQKGRLFRDLNTAKDSNEFTGDFAVKATTPVWDQLQVEARYLWATEDYVPGEESSYNLGYSNIFQRTNLIQKRIRGDFAFNSKQIVSIEYLTGTSIGHGYLSGSTWKGHGDYVGQEWDAILTWKLGPQALWTFAVAYFEPGEGMSATQSRRVRDPVTTGFSRINLAF